MKSENHKTKKPATQASSTDLPLFYGNKIALRAEILSIGDELTSGQRLDTNSQWLSQKLADLGVKTVFHTTVGDSLKDNIDAFRSASRRSDIVIASGGLGPTADDLTREAIAESFHAPLELRQEALDHIEKLFAKRARAMPERNIVQAMFPVGSRIIDNPHGTAPGIDLVVSSEPEGNAVKCRIFSLPGVPAEMKQMYLETVEKRLIAEMGLGKQRWYFHSLKVFGIGESDVEKRLPDLIHRERDPIVGITVSQATITLRVAALSSSQEEFNAFIAPTLEQIRSELGLLVFGEGDIDVDRATHNLLVDRKAKVGVIEVGAGAWIQHALGRWATGESEPVVASQWFPSMSNFPIAEPIVCNLNNPEEATIDTRRLASKAEEMLSKYSLDYCLGAGTYPTHAAVVSTTSMPSCELVYVLARRGKTTKHTTLSIGAAPDVLYHRLAKAGMNFLRLELLQHG